jgi:hypothetical protein
VNNNAPPPDDLPKTAGGFQKWEWRVQRAAWLVWGMIILAALSGLLGSGPLSQQTDRFSSDEGILRHERYLRYHTVTQLELELPAGALTEPFQVWIQQEYLDSVEIKNISPKPAAERVANGGVQFEFAAADVAPGKFVFMFEPNAMGNLTGKIKAGDAEPLSFRQFVYP